MNKKGGFRIETFILALIVFAIIVINGMIVITDVNENYDKDMAQDSDFNNTYDNAQQILTDTESWGDSGKTDVGGEIKEDSVEDSMFKGVFKAVRSVWNVFNLPGTVIQDLTLAMGAPSYLARAANVVLMILLLFAIIYMVFRFKPN